MKVLCYLLAAEDVVSVLAVGEVVCREVCPAFLSPIHYSYSDKGGKVPGKYYLIVHPVELHVL